MWKFKKQWQASQPWKENCNEKIVECLRARACAVRRYRRGADRHQNVRHPAGRASGNVCREVLCRAGLDHDQGRGQGRELPQYAAGRRGRQRPKRSQRHHRLHGGVGLEPEPGGAGDGHVLAAVHLQERIALLVVPRAAAGREVRPGARGKGHQETGLHRLGLTQPVHPDRGEVTGGSEGPEDPRHGIAGDGQDDGSAGRDRRPGGLGRALHRAADRRGGRRREQSPVGGRQEVL